MNRVTIIVPLYNKRDHIARALASIYAQTFPDFEVIVVDDGSSDDSATVVQECDRPGLRLIQQPNQGPGTARNRGVRESDSEYIAFLDADDELLPDFLTRNIDSLDKNANCGLSLCGSLRGPEKMVYPPPGEGGEEGGPWRLSSNASAQEIHSICAAMHVSVVFRREIFLSLGGFYEKGCTFAEDSYLWLQALLNCPIYREPEALMWYHTENAGLNLHHTQGDRENWSELRRARPLSPILLDPEPIRQNCPEEYRAALERYLAYEALSEALTRTSVGDASTARELRITYPKMERFRYNYAKLRMKLAYPGLIPFAARR